MHSCVYFSKITLHPTLQDNTPPENIIFQNNLTFLGITLWQYSHSTLWAPVCTFVWYANILQPPTPQKREFFKLFTPPPPRKRNFFQIVYLFRHNFMAIFALDIMGPCVYFYMIRQHTRPPSNPQPPTPTPPKFNFSKSHLFRHNFMALHIMGSGVYFYMIC